MTSDLETDIEVSAHAGFKALELWASKVDQFLTNHSLEALKALLNDHQITPLTLNSIEFIAFQGDAYVQIKERCRQLSKIAHAIACPTIVVVPSPQPARDTSWPEIVDEHVAVLRDLSHIAGEDGIRLAFEFLGFGWCSVRTPRGAQEIVEKTDRDNVGMVLDAAHFYAGGGLLAEIDGLDPDRIFAFHLDDVEDGPKESITDATRLLPGLGVVPLNEICQRLKRIGFDGPCSIELFRPEYWEWDPRELAAKVRASAVQVLSPHFIVE